MISSRLVVCLMLLASGVAFAQAPAASPPPLVPAPGQPEEPPPPQGELIPHTGRYSDGSSEPQGPSSRPFEATNVALETLGGLVLGLGAGIGSTVVIYGVMNRNSGCGDDSGLCGVAAALFSVPVLVAGVPLGVWGVGTLRDGEGRFLPTLGGALLGLGASVPLLFLANDSPLVLVGGVVLLPLAGAVIGYELSRPEPSRSSRYASTGASLVPVLGFTQKGGVLGGFAASF